MQIVTKCPHCSHPHTLPEMMADRRVTCKNCRILFKVPALEELKNQLNTLKNAQGELYIDKNGNLYG